MKVIVEKEKFYMPWHVESFSGSRNRRCRNRRLFVRVQVLELSMRSRPEALWVERQNYRRRRLR